MNQIDLQRVVGFAIAVGAGIWIGYVIGWMGGLREGRRRYDGFIELPESELVEEEHG